MSIKSDLQKLGLTTKEADVYLAGIELGPTTAQKLSKKSKINRATVYQIVENLKEKELFSETKQRSKRLFVAADPNMLKVIQNDREKILERLFPELRSLSNVTQHKPKTFYYDDIAEIKKVYKRLVYEMPDGSEYLDIASMDAAQTLGIDWINTFADWRKEKGISARTISDDFKDIHTLIERDKEDLREIRLFPEVTKTEIHVSIHTEKVFLTSLSSDETMGLLIESQKIRDSFAMMFEIMWQGLPSRT